MVTLDDVYGPIRKELVLVEKLILSSLMDETVPEIKKINSILSKSPGKRLRPAMVILSAYASMPQGRVGKDFEELKRNIVRTAAAIELIHMATLVHDDVMDESLLRHRKPTVNAVHGDNVAICAGDFLFARAFQLLSESGNAKLIGIASYAVKEVCEGQILQLWRRNNFGMGMKDYDSIINKKTSALFLASCAAGALVANSTNSLPSFGFHFGRGFQMIDDYLDIVSDEKTLGKKPGENLRAGELTLPAILLLQSVPAPTRATFAKRCMKDMGLLQKEMDSREIGKRVKKLVGIEMGKAESAIDSLAPSPYLRSFHRLLDLSVSRLKV